MLSMEKLGLIFSREIQTSRARTCLEYVELQVHSTGLLPVLAASCFVQTMSPWQGMKNLLFSYLFQKSYLISSIFSEQCVALQILWSKSWFCLWDSNIWCKHLFRICSISGAFHWPHSRNDLFLFHSHHASKAGREWFPQLLFLEIFLFDIFKVTLNSAWHCKTWETWFCLWASNLCCTNLLRIFGNSGCIPGMISSCFVHTMPPQQLFLLETFIFKFLKSFWMTCGMENLSLIFLVTIKALVQELA